MRLLPADATVVIGSIRRSGEGDLMVQGLSAMHVAFTTRSWKGNVRWSNDLFDRRELKNVLEARSIYEHLIIAMVYSYMGPSYR